MRIRLTPSPGASKTKDISSDDLQNEYELITRERQGGHNPLSAINAQNDIARELERRGEL